MLQVTVTSRWPLPKHDYWSTPFAEALLHHLHLAPGLTVLDIACGDGIPSFYLAEQVGPTGQVLGIDSSAHHIARAHAIHGEDLPWLRFQCLDMRALPATMPSVDRITGNLSVMFLRPHRFEAIHGLVRHLKPGGQLVLTFPSFGTFDSLWRRIDEEMARRALRREQERLAAHVAERPSAEEARQWLRTLRMERIIVAEWPLEIPSGSGDLFLHHPLLRGGFLDDAYECFDDRHVAEEVMGAVADDLPSFTPLVAQRCVVSGWKKEERAAGCAP